MEKLGSGIKVQYFNPTISKIIQQLKGRNDQNG